MKQILIYSCLCYGKNGEILSIAAQQALSDTVRDYKHIMQLQSEALKEFSATKLGVPEAVLRVLSVTLTNIIDVEDDSLDFQFKDRSAGDFSVPIPPYKKRDNATA